MKFLALFGVRLRHEGYPAGVRPDAALAPSEATRRLLARYRLRLQEQPDGLTVWAMARPDGKAPLLPLARAEVFGFELRAHSAEFALATDMAELSAMADPVYSNAALGANDARTLVPADRKNWHIQAVDAPADGTSTRRVLAAQPLPAGDAQRPPRASDISVTAELGTARVTAYDAATRTATLQASSGAQGLALRYRTLAPVRRDTLAEVQVVVNRSLPAPGSADADFEIRFKARAVHWAYYLVTDQPGDFAIIDADAAAPIVFGAQSTTLLNGAADASDPQAAALAAQYPGQRRIRFLSDQPVPCGSSPRKGLALFQGGQRVLGPLPNASLTRPTRFMRATAGAPQDQDGICQVLKYLKSR
ncbi:conserved hypothetical protein [Rubrivivax sp. A210]|uniref:hypothetical protein n=1 Tax=Rubrivivax sp. A210 TaxID=2772301 RepID=UPI001918D994|nr:hypothetical protein [Rubrivivax sp. A210]CAD5372260.1 conserved hypothetical protein [Rubrivivax sp. A210]